MTNDQHDLGDEIAGRAKEAWGTVTGDDRLRAEGREQHTRDDLVGAADGTADQGADGVADDPLAPEGERSDMLDAGADLGASDPVAGSADHGADGLGG